MTWLVEASIFCLLCQVAVHEGCACPECGAELIVVLTRDVPGSPA